eukprot:gene22676-29361_t
MHVELTLLIIVVCVLSLYSSFTLKANINGDKFIGKNFKLRNINALQKSNEDVQLSKPSALPPWLPSFVTAALGGLLFGSDIGSSSSVVRILGEKVSDFGSLDSIQLGQLASSSLLGAMIASASLIKIGDKQLGRKTELITASLLFTLGTILEYIAPSFSLELIGRAIYGLGIGTAMHVAPLYIAETSPSDIRGKLVSLKEAAIVGGIVLGYATGVAFNGDSNWRLIYGSVLPLEILMLFGALYVSESPRWLALRGKGDEAVKSIQRIQGISKDSAEESVKAMIRTADNNEKPASELFDELFSSPYNKQALLIGVGLVLLQQLSGQPSVLYFANRIFEQAGLGFEAALGVGIFKFVMTLISSVLVENPKGGRKSLLTYGSIGMTVALTLITLLFGFCDSRDPAVQNAIIACILGFVGSYQIGYGPITWLILSEIFPLKVRSAAVSIGTLANFGSNLLVTLLFEYERQNFGEYILFLQFTIVSLFGIYFINKEVFETRGLSLEDIEKKLRSIVDSK